jgi:hypothetical protein
MCRATRPLQKLRLQDTVPVPWAPVVRKGVRQLTVELCFPSAVGAVTESLNGRTQDLYRKGLRQVFELAAAKARQVVVHNAILPLTAILGEPFTGPNRCLFVVGPWSWSL